MYKMTITFEDYDENLRTEDCLFNLNESEMAEMELKLPGGFEGTILRIVSTQNQAEMIDIFKMILDKSYGIKSPDGRQFFKSEEILNNFKATRAYSDIYMKLITDSKAAADFINGIMSKKLKDISEQAKAEAQAKIEAYIPSKSNDSEPLA